MATQPTVGIADREITLPTTSGHAGPDTHPREGEGPRSATSRHEGRGLSSDKLAVNMPLTVKAVSSGGWPDAHPDFKDVQCGW